jgi:hypothetical protein
MLNSFFEYARLDGASLTRYNYVFKMAAEHIQRHGNKKKQ